MNNAPNGRKWEFRGDSHFWPTIPDNSDVIELYGGGTLIKLGSGRYLTNEEFENMLNKGDRLNFIEEILEKEDDQSKDN